MTNLLSTEAYQQFIDCLLVIVNKEQLIFPDNTDIVPYLCESRGRKVGKALLVALPKNKYEISKIIKACLHYKIPIVPQGGNTGRCLGALSENECGIVINLANMNKIVEFDAINSTITVEAGCTLQQVKQFVAKHNLLFPLTMGSEGSCQIGGNLATNAGGLNTIRYGNTRDLTLGIESVMANGEIINSLSKLRKDNTGYDLKNLVIGSEGTLAIITSAVLRLYPQETVDVQGLIAITDIEHAMLILNEANQCFNQYLSIFELIPSIAVTTLMQHSDIVFPLVNAQNQAYPYYIWYKAASFEQSIAENEAKFLENITEKKMYVDACIAQHQRQKDLFAHIREMIVEVQSLAGESIKFDISVPISNIANLINQINESLLIINSSEPAITAYPFGHIGDGNIHYNFLLSKQLNTLKKQLITDEITQILYDLVFKLNGSFSAEHGIGSLKTDLMLKYKDASTLELMCLIKQTLDPFNILNPQKVLPKLTNKF